MDYRFFETLPPPDAEAYFDRYLQLESSKVDAMLEDAAREGIAGDFTTESIPSVLAWIQPKIRVIAAEPARDTPTWLRDSMSEHGGFLEFEHRSRPLVLRASYYFGQAFVAEFSGLKWGLGRPDRAEVNQPVVTGFRTDADLPPLEVAENLLLRAHLPGFLARVQTAVTVWRKAV